MSRQWFETQRATSAPVPLTGSGARTRRRQTLEECAKEDAALLEPSGPSRLVHSHWVSPATVVHIQQEREPFYLACTAEAAGQVGRPCNRKVALVGANSWQCPAGHNCLNPVARYVLRVQVADATAKAFLSVFDEVGQVLLGAPAAQVKALWDARDAGDVDAGNQLEAIFTHACNQRHAMWIRSRREEYEGSTQIRMCLEQCTQEDSAAEGVEMQAEWLSG